MARRKGRMRRASKKRKSRMRKHSVAKAVGDVPRYMAPGVALGIGLWGTKKTVKQLPKIGSATEELL